MDSELEDDSEKLSKAIPVLSDNVKGLRTRVKERYLAKISVIGVDPASIPKEQFNGECLPPIEVSEASCCGGLHVPLGLAFPVLANLPLVFVREESSGFRGVLEHIHARGVLLEIRLESL